VFNPAKTVHALDRAAIVKGFTVGMDVKKSLTQLGIKLQLLDRPEQLQM
jgi:hypothetical protein